MNNFPELLTPQQVADIFKVSYHTALDIIKYSGIGYVKIGKQYRISKEKLATYLQATGNRFII